MENNVFFMSQAIMKQMKQNGMAHYTVKVYEHSVFSPNLQRYDELEKTSYDQDVMDGLMAMYKKQLDTGVISKALYNWRRRGILLLQDFHSTGEIHQGKYESRKAPLIPNSYMGIMREFVESLRTGESTKTKVTTLVRKFLICLAEREIQDVHDLQPEDVRRFIEKQHQETPRSMDSVIYAFHGLRRFFGTSIVSKGGTATLAAELLGHNGISATRQYISVDRDGMRKCVLSRSTLGGAL